MITQPGKTKHIYVIQIEQLRKSFGLKRIFVLNVLCASQHQD